MSLQQQLDLAEWSQWPIQLAIALIGLIVGIRFRRVAIGVVVGVVASWIGIDLMRFYIVCPLRDAVWAQDESKMPLTDSDVAGNAALLFLGWVLPLLSLLFILLLRHLWHRWFRLSDARTTAAKVA